MKNITAIKTVTGLVLQGLGFSPSSSVVKNTKTAIGIVALFSDASKNRSLKELVDSLKLSGLSFSPKDLDFLFDKYRSGGKNATLADKILKDIPIEELIPNIEKLIAYIDDRNTGVKYKSVDLAIKVLESLDAKQLSSYSSFLNRASRLQDPELKRRIAKLLRLISKSFEADDNSNNSIVPDVMDSPADYSDDEVEAALIERLQAMDKISPDLLHGEALFLESCLKEENKKISSLARRILLKMGVSENEIKESLKKRPGPVN